MTEIIGQPEWSPVRLLGIEPAMGGEDGNMNEQAKALVNRTELLNQEKAGKDEIIQGQYRFETLAKFDAKKSTLPIDCTVVIDEAGPNQGANTWDGVELKKSPYDPLQLAKNYADTNPNFKAGFIASGASLRTYTISGTYYKVGSSDITADLNYPVPLAGKLRVDTPTPGVTIHEYTVSSTAETYKCFLQGGVWSPWKQTETTSSVQAKIDASIKANVAYFEWFMTANNAQPFFDATTQTLFWSSPLIAPSRNHSANRIYIPAGSIVCDFSAVPNAVLYLDLSKVPTSGTLTVDDIPLCLKFASYPTWRGEPTLVPLAKQDRTQNGGVALVACDGFVRIKNSFENSIPTSVFLEWQKVANTTSVIFNKDTKILNISGYILAPYNNASGRIRIQDISIQFVNNFDIAYLDLTALGGTLDINASNKDQYIKVLPYSNASGYRAKSGQVALAKYFSADNMLTPAAGFLPISSSSNAGGPNSQSAFIEFEKTVSQMNVYLPSVNGALFRIGLQHQTVPASETSNGQSNADLWRIYQLFECDPTTKAGILELANTGEWECALTHTEDTQLEGIVKDHVGGYHGDELLTDAKFFIDGVLKPQDFTINGAQKANKIEFIQHSVIYFQNTSRPLCDHIKHITFTKDGVHLKQSLNFKYEAVNMNTAWITMLPVLRLSGSIQITDTSARSNDSFLQLDDNTASGFVRRYTPVNDGNVIKQWGSSSGYSFETELMKTPKINPNQNVFITNGGGYNKLYVSAIDGSLTTGQNVPLNTVWNIETMYRFNKTQLSSGV